MHLRIVGPMALAAAALLAGCGGSTAPDGPGPAALLNVSAGNGQSAIVGTVLTNPLVVTVTDAKSRPVPNASVVWTVTSGNGAVNPKTTLTDATGQTQTTFTLGTVAGSNSVTAAVAGVPLGATFSVTGTAGPLTKVSAAVHSLVVGCGTDSGRVLATTSDQFGNPVAGTVTWVSRNPSVATVDATGLVKFLVPSGATYVVASAGSAAPDSVLVQGAPPVTLSAAQVDVTLPGTSFCVKSTQPGTEFVLTAFYSSNTPGNATNLTVTGTGLGVVGSGANVGVRMMAPTVLQPFPEVHPNEAFEAALRARERQEMPKYVPTARAWYTRQQREWAASRADARLAVSPAPRRDAVSAGAPVFQQIPATAKVGDLYQLNTNANAYCSSPIMATARVAAISNTAIVVADTTNPAGGFTDAEYASFAAAMDTLVMPVDTTAFGAPSDIDHNNRVVIFFTKAVNQLTTDPSQGVVLGFYYSRDLLPATGSTQPCPGSNQAELFYLMVPDTAGTINGGNNFSKSKQNVANIVVGTIAHEFQHLINASRRMYIINSPITDEVTWLNEGLSHIAEELVFYRASGLGPRQNIGIAALSDPDVYNAFGLYMWGNRSRYQTLLPVVEIHGPIGEYNNDDDLSTRAATWTFLRYAADQRPADNTFFYRLVNSQTSGLANLQNVLGTDPLPIMRQWSTAVYANGTIPGISSAYDQPSWNWPQIFTLTHGSFTRPLNHPLTSSIPITVTIKSDAGAYFPFAVSNGTQALITVVGTAGTPLSSSIQLTLIRSR